MTIIIPRGRPTKKITLRIDDAGNTEIEAIDVRNFLRVPGQPERPLPLSSLETLYWLTKTASDALAATMKQIAEQAKGRPPYHPAGEVVGGEFGGASGDEKKTD